VITLPQKADISLAIQSGHFICLLHGTKLALTVPPTPVIEKLRKSNFLSHLILLSSRTKDSKWCERERTAMTNLRGNRPPFSYVFASSMRNRCRSSPKRTCM